MKENALCILSKSVGVIDFQINFLQIQTPKFYIFSSFFVTMSMLKRRPARQGTIGQWQRPAKRARKNTDNFSTSNFAKSEMQCANFAKGEMQCANFAKGEMQCANFAKGEMQCADEVDLDDEDLLTLFNIKINGSVVHLPSTPAPTPFVAAVPNTNHAQQKRRLSEQRVSNEPFVWQRPDASHNKDQSENFFFRDTLQSDDVCEQSAENDDDDDALLHAPLWNKSVSNKLDTKVQTDSKNCIQTVKKKNMFRLPSSFGITNRLRQRRRPRQIKQSSGAANSEAENFETQSVQPLQSSSPRYTPRLDQLKALGQLQDHFIKNNKQRGSLIRACGTGKTLIAQRFVERNAAKYRVVVLLVPSIGLVAQTLSFWRSQNHNARFLAVCSDMAVASDTTGPLSRSMPTRLGVPVTTNARQIAHKIARRVARGHQVVVFSTYHSVERLKLYEPGFDLAIFDEAHVCASKYHESMFALALSNQNLLVKQRLFMTATPKDYVKSKNAYSMDDESTFGTVMHRYTAMQATRDKVVVPLRAITVAVDDAAIEQALVGHERVQMLRDDRITKQVVDHRRLAQQYVVRKYMLEFEFDPTRPKKALLYFNSVQAAKDFHYKDLQNTQLAFGNDILVHHIDNTTPHGVRMQRLAAFERSQYPAVITNVNCLGVGISINCVDAVILCEPRRSPIDLCQIFGRPQRKYPGKVVGDVVVPVYVPEENGPVHNLSSQSSQGANSGSSVLKGEPAAIELGAERFSFDSAMGVFEALTRYDEELRQQMVAYKQYKPKRKDDNEQNGNDVDNNQQNDDGNRQSAKRRAQNLNSAEASHSTRSATNSVDGENEEDCDSEMLAHSRLLLLNYTKQDFSNAMSLRKNKSGAYAVFNDFLLQLQTHLAKHGTLKIDYKDDALFTHRVIYYRRRYVQNALPRSMAEKLREAGFIFVPNDAKFYDNASKYIAFKRRHDNREPRYDQQKKLARWVSNTQQTWRNKRLSRERIEFLRSIDFPEPRIVRDFF